MIYIDASRFNNTSQKTGVENYSYFLINELVKLDSKDITLISPRKIDLPAKQIIIPFPRLWTQIRLSWKILWNRKIDNLFVPSHVMPIIHPKNTTITIHDVAFKRYPKSYGYLSRLYLNWGTKFAVKHAKNIIVPSVTTKKDLIKYYAANEDKIVVIPLGYKTQCKDALRCASKIGKYTLKAKSYFLFVGRIESKKNVQTLIKAFNDVSKIHPHIKLVLAGKPGVGGDKIMEMCQGVPDIITTGYVSDEEKWALLKNCLCFVFPSLFEGFGIPLLEAMDANVPIIASKIPTSYEIAKENALFFEPHNVKALVKHMKNIIEKPELCKHLTQNHTISLKKYSWRNCASKTLKVLLGQLK